MFHFLSSLHVVDIFKSLCIELLQEAERQSDASDSELVDLEMGLDLMNRFASHHTNIPDVADGVLRSISYITFH